MGTKTLYLYSHTCDTHCCVFSYRKMVSNVCEGGLDKEQSTKQHNCPLLAPEGLQVSIKGQMLAVAPGDDITFIVHQERVGLSVFGSCSHAMEWSGWRLPLPSSGRHQQHQVPGGPRGRFSGHLPEPDGDGRAHPASLRAPGRLQGEGEGGEHGRTWRGHHVHPGHRSAPHTARDHWQFWIVGESNLWVSKFNLKLKLKCTISTTRSHEIEAIDVACSHSPSAGSSPGGGSHCQQKPRGQSDGPGSPHWGQPDRLLLVDRRQSAGEMRHYEVRWVWKEFCAFKFYVLLTYIFVVAWNILLVFKLFWF